MPDWVSPIRSPAAVKPGGVGHRHEAAQEVGIEIDAGHGDP